jgi:hypothetical protein
MMAIALLRPEGLQHFTGAHRQLPHAHAGGVMDGVGNRRHRRDDRYFADAPQAKGMSWISHFHQYRLDHRQVQARQHAIAQEAGVKHGSLGIKEVFFIQRPADPLDHSPLDLPFHITRTDGLADVLQSCISRDLSLAGLRIDLDINDMESEVCPDATRRQIGAADDRTSGRIEASRQVSEGQTSLGVATITVHALGILNLVGRDFPEFGGSLDHLPLDVMSCLVAGPPRLEGGAATTGR